MVTRGWGKQEWIKKEMRWRERVKRKGKGLEKSGDVPPHTPAPHSERVDGP